MSASNKKNNNSSKFLPINLGSGVNIVDSCNSSAGAFALNTSGSLPPLASSTSLTANSRPPVPVVPRRQSSSNKQQQQHPQPHPLHRRRTSSSLEVGHPEITRHNRNGSSENKKNNNNSNYSIPAGATSSHHRAASNSGSNANSNPQSPVLQMPSSQSTHGFGFHNYQNGQQQQQQQQQQQTTTNLVRTTSSGAAAANSVFATNSNNNLLHFPSASHSGSGLNNAAVAAAANSTSTLHGRKASTGLLEKRIPGPQGLYSRAAHQHQHGLLSATTQSYASFRVAPALELPDAKATAMGVDRRSMTPLPGEQGHNAAVLSRPGISMDYLSDSMKETINAQVPRSGGGGGGGGGKKRSSRVPSRNMSLSATPGDVLVEAAAAAHAAAINNNNSNKINGGRNRRKSVMVGGDGNLALPKGASSARKSSTGSTAAAAFSRSANGNGNSAAGGGGGRIVSPSAAAAAAKKTERKMLAPQTARRQFNSEDESYRRSNVITSLTASELDKMKKLFDHHDVSQSGSIDEDELLPLLIELGHPMPKAQALDLLAQVDVNGNGMLEFSEFLQLLLIFKNVAQFRMYEEEDDHERDRGDSRKPKGLGDATALAAARNKRVAAAAAAAAGASVNSGAPGAGIAVAEDDNEEESRKVNFWDSCWHCITHFFPLSRQSYFHWAWEVILLAVCVFIFGSVTSSYAFRDVHQATAVLSAQFDVADIFCTILIAIEILRQAVTKVRVTEDGKVRMMHSVCEIACRYATSREFVVDLLSLLPLRLIVSSATADRGGAGAIVAAHFRLFFLYHLKDIMNRPSFADINRWFVYFFLSFAPPILGIAGFLCVLHFFSIISYRIDLTNTYAESVYVILYCFSGAGFGNVRPQSSDHRLFLSGMCLMSMIVNGFVIGSIVSFFSSSDVDSVRKSRLVQTLAVLDFFSVPVPLQEEILQFQNHLMAKNIQAAFGHIVESLPSEMKVGLGLQIRIQLVRGVYLFRLAHASTQIALAQELFTVVLCPEEFVALGGEPGEEMFFISYGFVDVLTAGGVYCQTLKVYESFGAETVLGPVEAAIREHYTEGKDEDAPLEITTWGRYANSAKTLTYVELLGLNVPRFDIILRQFPRFRKTVEQELVINGAKSAARQQLFGAMMETAAAAAPAAPGGAATGAPPGLSSSSFINSSGDATNNNNTNNNNNNNNNVDVNNNSNSNNNNNNNQSNSQGEVRNPLSFPMTPPAKLSSSLDEDALRQDDSMSLKGKRHLNDQRTDLPEELRAKLVELNVAGMIDGTYNGPSGDFVKDDDDEDDDDDESGDDDDDDEEEEDYDSDADKDDFSDNEQPREYLESDAFCVPAAAVFGGGEEEEENRRRNSSSGRGGGVGASSRKKGNNNNSSSRRRSRKESMTNGLAGAHPEDLEDVPLTENVRDQWLRELDQLEVTLLSTITESQTTCVEVDPEQMLLPHQRGARSYHFPSQQQQPQQEQQQQQQREQLQHAVITLSPPLTATGGRLGSAAGSMQPGEILGLLPTEHPQNYQHHLLHHSHHHQHQQQQQQPVANSSFGNPSVRSASALLNASTASSTLSHYAPSVADTETHREGGRGSNLSLRGGDDDASNNNDNNNNNSADNANNGGNRNAPSQQQQVQRAYFQQQQQQPMLVVSSVDDDNPEIRVDDLQ